MNRFLERAQELYGMMKEDQRYLHMHAEVGCDLPVCAAYIRRRLSEIGLIPEEIGGSGITALIGGKKPGKTILLRADFDALPITEQTDLTYKSGNGCAHACGHDLHAAILLGAAQILKECEEELDGCVKLMFQPGEETLCGAKEMIEAGILENPKPDAALAMHTTLDWSPYSIGYGVGFVTSSVDLFEITIQGVGCHGAMPHTGIDPIQVGVQIYQGFQDLIARENRPGERVSLTFGQFQAGNSENIIPDRAVLKGTLRTYDNEVREKMLERMHEIAEYCGKMYRTEVRLHVRAFSPALYSDPALTKEMGSYVREMGETYVKSEDCQVMASEDFAFVAEKIPSVFFSLGCRPEGEVFPHHHPRAVFHEAAMPFGAAVHAQCAYEWLRAHASAE